MFPRVNRVEVQTVVGPVVAVGLAVPEVEAAETIFSP